MLVYNENFKDVKLFLCLKKVPFFLGQTRRGSASLGSTISKRIKKKKIIPTVLHFSEVTKMKSSF